VGVNVYSMPYHNDDITALAGAEDPIQLTDFVYRQWADSKPIQISEYGAAHDTVLDDASYVNFAINRMSRMYRGLLAYYPRVKTIFYFDINAIQNGQTGRQFNNYDVTSDSLLTNAYRALIGQSNYLSNIGADIEGTVADDLFELKGPRYAYDGRQYVRLSDFLAYSSGSVISRTATAVNVTANGQSFALSLSTSDVIKINDVEYVAVEIAAARAGYTVTRNATYNTMTLTR